MVVGMGVVVWTVIVIMVGIVTVVMVRWLVLDGEPVGVEVSRVGMCGVAMLLR